jgi:hypothetical protein
MGGLVTMLNASLRAPLFAAAFVLLATPAAIAESDIRTERVQFKRGANSAVIEGTITARQTVDYVLEASKGQYMNVSMATKNGATYFNILAPGETEVAMFNGSVSENQFEGVLPESGEYKIRVYMMRSAARRNEVANRVEMIVSGVAAKSSTDGRPSGGDALVKGTNYNATGNIPCAMALGQPTGSCPFGVKREGNGSGIVTVTKPDGRTRVIFFENGKAIGYNVSEADPGAFSAEKQGDLSIVRIGTSVTRFPTQ